MARKDKGIRRSDRSPDRTFTFKLNPDDEIEGPIIDSIDTYRTNNPEAGLRHIVVDVFSRIEYRPPTREDALLETQRMMQEQIERLVGMIDKLMKAGYQPGANTATPISVHLDDELDLDYLAQIKNTMKRSQQ